MKGDWSNLLFRKQERTLFLIDGFFDDTVVCEKKDLCVNVIVEKWD